jgi:DNA-binding CsgD family transcriptional regulator
VTPRLDSGARTDLPAQGTPGPGHGLDSAQSTAVVLGDDARSRRAVAAAIARGRWTVQRPTADHARASAAVTVVHTVPPEEAAAIVSSARAMGHLVVVVVGDVTVQGVRALLDAGADAVVPADRVDTQLEPAMAAVEAGLVVAPRGELWNANGRPALTAREKQALAMVVMGFSNAEIATKLFVAESTVKSHLSSAFAKLGVRTRNEATALILDRTKGLGTGILAIVGGEDAGSG